MLGKRSNSAEVFRRSRGDALDSNRKEEGTEMLILTTVYCAEAEHIQRPGTGKVIEMTLTDLKEAERKLLGVYQGTNRVLPLDGER